ncbi:MAG: primosomal protein N' [Peptococcaceae bacterium]|nr:primosomal protein N' [Peptococcaceae bacterium]
MTHHFAEVVVDIHNRKVDRSFHYAIPHGLKVELGCRVIVPFNRRTMEGIVVGFSCESPVAAVKPLLDCVDSEAYLSPELIELSRWMADYYLCPFIQALKCVLPSAFNVRRDIIVEALVALEDPHAQALILLDEEAGKLFAAVARSKKPVKLANLKKRLDKQSIARLDDLVERGMLRVSTQFNARMLSDGAMHKQDALAIRAKRQLTPEQTAALAAIQTAGQQPGSTVLLYGVTGSGKTEVYVESVRQVLQLGQTALVLVPEISLTPQIYAVFASAFPGQVAMLHSALSEAERAVHYLRILAGEAKVVVGARSAVFAPLKHLGLIIVDEEHEQTYKQEDSPKYHVREVAQKRAELCGCNVILGSATPSLESYALALTGRYRLVNMLKRVDDRPLPPVETVDLREELLTGNTSIFSHLLLEKMQDCLNRGEQIILFLNRRGYSTFVVCRACGYVVKCPHCDISLTYHQKLGQLRCHYCNYAEDAPQVCPVCSSHQIRYFGLGTQRVEQEIAQLFPASKVLRLDADATGKQGAHKTILDDFRQGGAQILVGTQMLAKGLDFPRVTLVGVISADSSLHMPDFRSKERTFQLLTQVAGRAGRGEMPGQVVIQTFSPDDPSIALARDHNFPAFFRQEIQFRQTLGYPPFNHILRVVLASEDEGNLIKCAQDLGGALRQELVAMPKSHGQVMEILGPAPSPLRKLRNRYRWQVIVKGKQVQYLKSVTGAAIKKLYQYSSTGGIALSIDLDPMGML